MEITRKEIMPSVSLTSVRTDKFKTSCMGVTFCLQLSREEASKNALLPKVLLRGCSSHPDMESLSAAKDELYGTKIEPVVRNKGEVQCVGLIADFIDDAYVSGGEKLLEKVTSLIGEILLSPATNDGVFDAKYVESEREKHVDQIKALLNDKQRYAGMRLKELMFADEAFAVDPLGSVEDTMKITPESLTEHYRAMIQMAQIEIFYCGSAGADRIEAALLNAFKNLPRTGAGKLAGTVFKPDVGDVRYFSESLDIGQGKLSLGFRLGKAISESDYAALIVFNAIYGGSVTSKLFMNVREKLSLCYYASSRIERFKGVMFVSSGIEINKYDEALSEILHQLELCKSGDISGEEFSNARNSLINDIRSMMDGPTKLEDYYLGQALESVAYSPEDLARLVSEVSMDQVKTVAQNVHLDSVYFLKNDGRGEK